MRNILFAILIVLCFILLLGCEHSEQNQREKVGLKSPLEIQSNTTINKIDSNQKKDIKLQKIDNLKYSIKKCFDESEAIKIVKAFILDNSIVDKINDDTIVPNMVQHGHGYHLIKKDIQKYQENEFFVVELTFNIITNSTWNPSQVIARYWVEYETGELYEEELNIKVEASSAELLELE